MASDGFRDPTSRTGIAVRVVLMFAFFWTLLVVPVTLGYAPGPSFGFGIHLDAAIVAALTIGLMVSFAVALTLAVGILLFAAPDERDSNE